MTRTPRTRRKVALKPHSRIVNEYRNELLAIATDFDLRQIANDDNTDKSWWLVRRVKVPGEPNEIVQLIKYDNKNAMLSSCLIDAIVENLKQQKK